MAISKSRGKEIDHEPDQPSIRVPNMRRIETLRELPISGSGCENLRVTADAINLTVEYSYLETGELQVGVVTFANVIAYKFRNELHSKKFVQESYDSIVEIHDSDWLTEINKIEPPGTLWPWQKHHFALFLSNYGYLEVIADHFQESQHGSSL